MAWPTGVTLRTCSLGPDFGIVSGDDYGCDIVVSVSRPMMTWGATGSGGIGDQDSLSFTPGMEITFQLPVTDQAGWYIGGLPIDVSGGRQSHVYTLTIKPWIYNSLGRKTFSNATLTLSNLAVPTGADTLDLDKSVATAGAQGGTVTIPDLLADLQASVDDYKTELETVAAAPTDDFVADRIEDPASQTTAALNAAIGAADRAFEKDRRRWYDIRDYGARVDGVVLTDASMTAGSAVLTTAHAFTGSDEGKAIAVMGAGPVLASLNDGVLITTIASVASGVATLAATATTTCNARRAVFGTPDDAAFASARDAAVTAGGGVVYIPSGHTIVTVGHAVSSYVSYRGDGMDASWVHPFITAPTNTSAAPTIERCWLTADGFNTSNMLTGAWFVDFGIEAEAMVIASGGVYTSDVKPLNIHNVIRSGAVRLQLRNTPATAIPFDESIHCLIGDNYVNRFGRLRPAASDAPGGSGIGIGTAGTGSSEPTLVIGNTIIGANTPSAYDTGQFGIFVEAQDGASANTPTPGYRIIGNHIEACYGGIGDQGSRGTIISNNVVTTSVTGIWVRSGGLASAHPGVDTLIEGNVILDSVGQGATDGTGIKIESVLDGAQPNVTNKIRSRVLNNIIISPKARGIAVVAGGGINIDGITIRGNHVRGAGRSGILVLAGTGGGVPANLVIESNEIEFCGSSAIANDQAGITLAVNVTKPIIISNRTYQSARGFEVVTGVTVGASGSGGRIQNNDWGTKFIAGTVDASVNNTGNDV